MPATPRSKYPAIVRRCLGAIDGEMTCGQISGITGDGAVMTMRCLHILMDDGRVEKVNRRGLLMWRVLTKGTASGSVSDDGKESAGGNEDGDGS